MTQRGLARRAGVSRETIYRIESGRTPSAAVVFAVQRALELDYHGLVPDWLTTADPAFPCFGARIRWLRRSLGLSLEAVAGQIGVSAGTLSRFETEQAYPPVLVRCEKDRRGEPKPTIISDALATALGLPDAAALHEFCERGHTVTRQPPRCVSSTDDR